MFSLVALKDEIVNDTQGLGYKNSPASDDWKGDQVIADLLNDTALGEVIRRTAVLPAEIQGVILVSDFNALSPKQTGWIAWAVSGDAEVDMSPDAIHDGLISLFVGKPSAIPLLAVLDRPGSRAEVLWGDGVGISASLVGRAFNELP